MIKNMDKLHRLRYIPMSTQIRTYSDAHKPSWIPFSKANHGKFLQESPELKNPWTHDSFAKKILTLLTPSDVAKEISSDLTRFGDRIVNEIDELGNECEINPPTLQQYNAWGRLTNELRTCQAWKDQKSISAEEGLIAIPYENKQREFSRLYQALKLYLYAPSSGLYSCPLAMTDGAAKCIKSLSLASDSPYSNAYSRLTTRDTKKFWTSGQWMTEKGGGSDVASGTETLAVHETGDQYKLYGYKWFSSATDSDMSLTLARITDSNGNHTLGTKGLTMFYLQTFDEKTNELNGINVIKLKNKLGTRQLPTAELLLDGTLAHKMSDEGRGVAAIADMLQITRLHNSISAVACMRRCLMMTTDYANKRKAFGKFLNEYPLHNQTLAKLEIEARAGFILMMEMALLLGKVENNVATNEDKVILRLLNPVTKLYTAKQAIATASESLEAIGGQGYIEDTFLPRALRDAQVLSIWEGTTNVLSLDVLRVLMKTNGEALHCFASVVNSKIGAALTSDNELSNAAKMIKSKLKEIGTVIAQDPKTLEAGARYFAYSLARVYAAACMIELATKSGDKQIITTAIRWSSQDLFPFLTNYKIGMFSSNFSKEDSNMLYSKL